MIKQRSWGDCGVATLLNALIDNGVSEFSGPDGYDKMVDLLGRDSGITIQEVCAVLYTNGLVPVYLPLDGFAAESGIHSAFTIDQSTLTPGIDQPKCIVQVKTKSGLLHMLYCDGEHALDPAVNVSEPQYLGDYESIVDAVFILPVEQDQSENKPAPTITITNTIDSCSISQALEHWTPPIIRHRGGFTSNRKGLMGEGL